MASYTKTQRRQLEEIHARIVDGHRRGVCDSDGNTVFRPDGTATAKPRGGYVTRRFRWDRKLGKLVQVYPQESADRIDRNDEPQAADREAQT